MIKKTNIPKAIINHSNKKITFKFRSLFKWQEEVYYAKSRFRVLNCSRQIGKSTIAEIITLKEAIEKPNSCILWAAPVLEQSTTHWKHLSKYVQKINDIGKKYFNTQLIKKTEKPRVLTFWNGSVIYLRTADYPDSLRGPSYSFVVLDEFAFMKQEVWTSVIRPTLSATKGKAIIISTPAGKNHFFDLCNFAQTEDGIKNGWSYYEFDYKHSPNFTDDEINEIIKTTPEGRFKTEYCCRFLESEITVFKDVQSYATAKHQDEAIEDHEYYFGIDIGRSTDPTCVCVFDKTINEMVNINRFWNTRYLDQVDKINEVYERFNPKKILVEANSAGKAVLESLEDEFGSWKVSGYYSTNKSKIELIDKLIHAFETNEIKILNHPDVIEELENYEQTMSALNRVTYNAPNHKHDDIVISLALAYWEASKNKYSTFAFIDRNALGI